MNHPFNMGLTKASIHGFIGSALIGTDPFDPRSWSGISRFLFQECERQGILHGATGGEVTGAIRMLLLVRSFHPSREKWRLRYYLSSAYRQALTRKLSPAARRLPQGVNVLQLGALFNLVEALRPGGRCYSYHDGNMAMRLKNPRASTAIPSTLAQQAMAYERRLYHKLDRIFTMSEHLRRSFITDFEVPPEKVVCIGAGVNLDRLPSACSDKRYDTGQILFVGVEFARKGGHVLLEAFAQVRREHPAAILHIVGPRTAPPADLPLERVEWHGHLNKHKPDEARKLDELFRSSSVFVLPSLYEPFGIAPAEAMMHNLPAVVSGDWALGETVLDGVTGLHVKPGDTASLCNAIQKLLASPQAAYEMGQAARQRAVKNFTWENVVKRLRNEILALELPTKTISPPQ